MKKHLLMSILTVSMLLSLTPIITANNLETRVFYGTPDIVVSDWPGFWLTFIKHASWSLEGDVGAGWEDANDYLTILREYRTERTCKITLIFDAPLDGNYRFTFAIDKRAKQYFHKAGALNYTLIYEGYGVIFDWSDMLEIPGIVLSHGLTDNCFWFRIRRDNVPKDAHVEIDPEVTIFVTSSDGHVRGNDTVYATARDKTVADVLTNATNNLYIGQYNMTATQQYRIYRTMLFFDTSSIPEDVDISAANISLLFQGGFEASQDWNLTVQNGQPTYPHEPIVNADYNRSHYSENGGYVEVNAAMVSWQDIPLNEDGISWINTEGVTKFCLRSSRDIAGIPPVFHEEIYFYSYEQGQNEIPRLVITYPGLFERSGVAWWVDNIPMWLGLSGLFVCMIAPIMAFLSMKEDNFAKAGIWAMCILIIGIPLLIGWLWG